MPKVKSYLNPNIPRPTPSPSTGEAARYKTQPVKPGNRRGGERGGTVRPLTPQAEKRPPKKLTSGGKKLISGGGSTKPTPKPLPKPINKPGVKPINKPGVKPSGGKTGPRRSKQNDIIRNQRRPEGTK